MTSRNEIPTRAREVVRERDRDSCVRCGMGGAGRVHFHHRKRRRVKWEHQHCACVGVTLCPVCHEYVHKHPAASREKGWIVSEWEEEPWNVPLKTFAGIVFHRCDGTVHFLDA